MSGFHFTALFPGYRPKIGGLWSAISAIVVTQSSRKETTSSASLRIIGSAVGALTSALYPSFLPSHPAGMAAVLIATVVICSKLRISSAGRGSVPRHPGVGRLLTLNTLPE
jgi:uncharacterized membrane protein YccC